MVHEAKKEDTGYKVMTDAQIFWKCILSQNSEDDHEGKLTQRV